MNRKFAKIIALILASIMVIMTGCTSNVADEPKRESVVKLNIAELGDVYIESVDSNENYCVATYYDFIEEVGGEAEIDENTEQKYHIAIFDTNKKTLIKSIEYNNDGKYYKAKMNDAGFDLYNQDAGEKIQFDFELNEIAKGTYDFEESWVKGEKIKDINTERFECRDTFAKTDDFNAYTALLFYDKPTEFKVIRNNSSIEYCDVIGHKALITDYSGNKKQDYTNVFKVYDFDNNQILNDVRIENDLDFNNLSTSSINDVAATISTGYDNGKLKEIIVWYYNTDAKNTPFEDGFCKTVPVSEIQAGIDEVTAQVKEKYNIPMEVNVKKEFFDHETDNDFLPILFYLKALEIEHDLGYFSKEFYSELLCNDIDNAVSTFDEFRIYLVGNISDDISAYAGNVACDETDDKMILYTVYSCSGYSRNTFFHEMMHQMEYRIWNYEKDFDDKWEAMNPKGFEYANENEENYYDNEEWQSYFVRGYGMRSILEDRADCFGTMCDTSLDNDEWWKQNEQLVSKMDYLTSIIQKSYPSLKENPFWV